MTTLFRGTTNGGANRVFLKNDDLKIGGQAVKGRQSLDAETIADVWGGTLSQSASLKEGSTLADINDATISVVATGGEAFIKEALVAALTGTGNINQVETFGPKDIDTILSKFTGGLENALDRATIRSNDNGFEVAFGGQGVSGSVTTNANFATEAEAQEFLDSLLAQVGQPDTYSVVVSDDDLDGDFVFDFSGWYRDVNFNKIEGKLEGSDVEFDGSIDSKAEGAAANLALFLEQMADGGESFVFDQLEKVGTYGGNFDRSGATGLSSEAIDLAITDLETVLANGTVRQDSEGFWEIRFSGAGIGGALNTEADFATQQDAIDFLNDLRDFSRGFLDDALF